jgi:thymidylate synthase (FAD)
MKIVSPNVELLRQEPGLEGIFKQIELAGRTCYKSEDKIDKYSAKVFVERMIESKHYAMLEHGTVYLTFVINNNNRDKEVHFPWYHDNAKVKIWEVFSYIQWLFASNKYSVVKLSQNKDYTETTMCITTNYRVIVENGWQGIMNEFLSEPTIYHERRITLKFTTNIGVTREGNRHRVNSIAEESTRYCNYSKDKFDNQVTYCKPAWITQEEINSYNERAVRGEFEGGFDSDSNKLHALSVYLHCLHECSRAYDKLIRLGWTAQQAREVLPLATKSEVIYTAFAKDWKHFFDLRLYGTTGKPHPNMFEVAEKASKLLIEEDLIDIDKSLWDLIYPPQEPIEAPNNY